MCTKLLIVSKKMALAVGMCLMSVTSVLGQSVGEAALIAAVGVSGTTLGNKLDETNSLQQSTLAQNTIITGLLNNIQSYEEKMYNYMSEAQSIVTSAYTISRCIKLGADIVTELNECRKQAQDHPQGLLVSSMVTNQYSDILEESAALVSYLTPIVKGSGDKNLLNSAERIRILNSVSSRLYNLYASVNRLKQNIMRMRWSHLVREISPELYHDFISTESAYDFSADLIERASRNL